ncbi:sulfotransferase [Luteimonas terrae]|uniref:Sulfotransferase family protein n=1 Tax=Luteimonas terrae TaxID=1530191 RepID=A0A4R5U7M9_9GAMM|nr:sulfotransferase [Luteimonas terrae]TDK29987.1 hypothetical protein E2F49_12340 [Luteimonas terrae]
MSVRLDRIGILVAGMHRSGTSAITGCLESLGVALGTGLLPPGSDNPKGYFESERAVRIDDALLAGLDRRWDDARALPAGWTETAVATSALAEIAALLQDEFPAEPVFAIKDPRLSRLLPVWLDALRRTGSTPRVVLVVRHPSEVAASIQKRNGWSPAVSELLWLRHMLAAERDSRGVRRVAVTYDQLIDRPLQTMTAALGALGVEVDGRGDVLDAFVSAGDRHFEGGEGAASGTGLTEIATGVYKDCVAMAGGQDVPPAAFDRHAQALETLLSSTGPLVDGLGGMALAFARRVEEAEAELATVRSSLEAQLAWSKSAVEARERLNAELARVQSELAAQVSWSESAVAERERLHAAVAELRSNLTAQTQWSEHAVDERDRLNAALAKLRSDLTAQIAWSESAVVEREKMHETIAQLRSDLAAQVRWSEESMAVREQLRAELAEASVELDATRLEAQQSRQHFEAREAALASDADCLRRRLERYESSLFGKLHRRWVDRNSQDTPDTN